MNLTPEQLNALLQRKSISERNPELRSPLSDPDTREGKAPKLEPAFGDVALGEASIQKANSARFRVCVCSVRKRLLDEDNLCEKYLVDQCRSKGFIPDDCPATTKIEVSQRRAAVDEEEHVEIIISKIS
jgi:hypothetical protein